MVDVFSKKKRSEIMGAVKSKGSKMELAVEKTLDKKGIRFRKNVRSLPGTPDIVFVNKKLVIFLDSCFWHGCRWHCNVPTSNRKFWVKKIQENKKRDKMTNLKYKRMDWKVLRFWEHQLKQNQNVVVDAVIAVSENRPRLMRLSVYEKAKTTKK